jgi:hypothetical protein
VIFCSLAAWCSGTKCFPSGINGDLTLAGSLPNQL